MLAGLAAQSLTLGTARTAWAFGTAAIVFGALLAAASIGVSVATTESVQPVRMVGSTIRRGSGYVLMAAGVWFVVLALAASPLIGR